MAGWGVTPAIRVRDMAAALAFYVDRVGFQVDRGGPDDDNVAISRGDAKLMLEAAGDVYSQDYNEAIRRRVGTPSAIALYMEAPDLEALYEQVRAAGEPLVDPLAERPWGQYEFTVADPDGTWLAFWRSSESD